MFSNNRKVSYRQIRRLIILNFFGASALILPAELSRGVGRDGLLSIMIGGIATMAFALFLCFRLNQFSGGILEELKRRFGKILFYICIPLYLIHLVIVAAFLINLLAEVVQDMLLLDASRNVIMLVSLLLCGYGAKKGMEARGRICEIAIYFVMIPLILMIILAGRDININYLAPIATSGGGNIFWGAYQVFAGFSTLSVFVLMGGFMNDKSKLKKDVLRGIGIVIVLIFCLYGIALGFFQETGMQFQRWPGINLIAVINTPGGFLQRYDAFLIAVFLISILIGLSSCIFYGSYLLQEVVGKKSSIFEILFMIAVFFVGLCFKGYNYAYDDFWFYLLYIGTPVMVILPILFWKRGDKHA